MGEEEEERASWGVNDIRFMVKTFSNKVQLPKSIAYSFM